MSEWYHLGVHLFLMAFLIFSEVRNYLERKSLLNRLMSRDFTDFAGNETSMLLAARKPPKSDLEHIEL